MIAELLDSKASFAAVINYNERVVKKGKGEILSHHNMITFTGQERIKWLEEAAMANTRIKYPVFHVAIAFDYADKVNNSLLDQIGHEYMAHMGYRDCSYVIYRHEDKKHTHIHVVGSRVDQAGKKVNDSFEQYKSESLCRNMEVKYQLRRLGEGTKPVQVPVSRIQSRIWDKEKPVFNRINNEVQFILKEYKPTDLEQFKVLAKRHFIDVQERKDPDGKALGLVYAITYQDGRRDHKGISGSSFRHDYSLNGLKRVFEKNAGKNMVEKLPGKPVGLISEHDKAYYTREINTVYREIRINQFMRESDFVDRLNRIGVKPVFARNASGYYGISFQLLAKNNLIIKGSDIDKSLSYNSIRGRIIGEGDEITTLLTLIGQRYKSTFKLHGLHERPTVDSTAIYLSRLGFKVSVQGEHFMLDHQSLTGRSVKIPFAQMEKAFGESIALPGTIGQKISTTGLNVAPFNPAQWAFMETVASNNAIKILQLLQDPEFYRTKRFSLQPEEQRLFAPQIRHMEQLRSFHARLLASIKLISQLQNPSTQQASLNTIRAITAVLQKSGISLFADQKGHWFFKDYAETEVIPVNKYPLAAQDRKTFLAMLNTESSEQRFSAQIKSQELPPLEEVNSYAFLAALISRDFKKATELSNQGAKTDFTVEELVSMLGTNNLTAPKGDESPENDWDKLVDDIQSLAEFLLYDNWRGIQDEDQLRSTVPKRKKRR